MLTEDILAKTVGADPLDIQSTFVGAVCRWQAANPAGLIDITRFWFEQGSLDNEKQGGAEFLKYQIENRSIAGVAVDRDEAQRPNGCVRRGQRRGRRGRVVGEPADAGHRCVRAGDQADGADAGHQLLAPTSARACTARPEGQGESQLAGHVEADQRGAAERQLVPRLAGAQHRDRRRRELRRNAFGRGGIAVRPRWRGREPATTSSARGRSPAVSRHRIRSVIRRC